jgi:acyl-CoA thioesterase-1
MHGPISAFLKTAGVALALLGGMRAAAAGQAANVTRCLSYAATMNLGAPLPRARALLRQGQSITIVALGSSSTVGFGTFDKSYPQVLKAELIRLHPSLHVTMINSGVVLDTIPRNLARLDKDVLRYQPDLVIWQLGTNDVLWRGIAANAEQLVRGGVRRLKKAGADVILMDLQYAPVVRRRRSASAMEKLIAAVAREEQVGLFSRFDLMRRAAEGGVKGLVGFDSLHNSGAGYRCVGLALARLIERDSALAH